MMKTCLTASPKSDETCVQGCSGWLPAIPLWEMRGLELVVSAEMIF